MGLKLPSNSGNVLGGAIPLLKLAIFMPGTGKDEPLIFVPLSYYLAYFGDEELLFTAEGAEDAEEEKRYHILLCGSLRPLR